MEKCNGTNGDKNGTRKENRNTRLGNTYCLESSFVSFMYHMFYFGISFVLLFGSLLYCIQSV